MVRCDDSAATVTRLEEGWRSSPFGWLGVLRGWGTRAFRESLPADESGLAAALLLGDTTALDREEWDAYVRTGVVHVLAISGQHLVILAGFVWFVLKVFGVRRRYGAVVVIAVMLGYAFLTGGRPSAVRAAVMVCAYCGVIISRRPLNMANTFALAWLVIVALNPTDPFTLGFQSSFLSVFVLIWGAARGSRPRHRRRLNNSSTSRGARPRSSSARSLRAVGVAFAVSFILAVVNAPLILYWQNIASPLGVVLGPPLILLTSIALICGFLVLMLSPFGFWAAWPLARITELSLSGCEALVHAAEFVPGGWVYSPGPSMVWLAGFYVGVVGLVLLPLPWSKRCLLALILWVFVGLAASDRTRVSDELRVTFLAVGHGGCVVIETPDGRVLLYDAGTTSGPEAVRRTIAPYLWSRGVTSIDEVFLSHADLDHFNGMPELLRRFPVCADHDDALVCQQDNTGRGDRARGVREARHRAARRGGGRALRGRSAGDRRPASADGRARPARGREPAEYGSSPPSRRADDPPDGRPGGGGAGARSRAAGSICRCDARAAPRREVRERGAARAGWGAVAGADGDVGAAEARRLEPAAGSGRSPRGGIRRRRRGGVGHAEGGGSDSAVSQ